MASDSEACCESDPNFAVICGFLEKFGVTCGLANIDFLDLQDMLENSQEVPQELVDLHVKLLRKARKSVSSERWERALIKLCHGFCSQDAWEIERFGYKKARLSSKLRILKELLEMQFDYNAKFKNEINKLSAEELRTQPLGKDRVGHVYWFQSDNSCQIRVYKEDPDEETWSLVAKDREGLVNLITHLNDGQVTLLNEDSNSLESEKPIVDTGQTTDSNSNSNSSKQDQASTDTNTEANQVEVNKSEENDDNEKPQLDEEENTQNNIEVVKINKMKLKNNKVLVNNDSSDKTGESLGNGNGSEDPSEQEFKNENNSEQEEKDKCSSSTLSPTKTGISIRIKPISELISTNTSGVDVNKKTEITGVKEKYIRSDCSSSSSVYHRKAVDSAGFDVHTNYLKRPIEEEEDVQEPSYIKRPRLDRPTLLGNKKKKPYSDEEEEEEEEEDEEEVSDEVEEPLMLVTGEGFGQDNEGGNSRITETGSPVPEDDSPIVGEEIVESVVYVYGEGNGHECETGNESNSSKQDVASQQQNTTENTTANMDSPSNSNIERTSHEPNKADTVDSIKDIEPSSNNDEETDCSGKTPTKSEIKLGTIIDVRANKSASPARDPAKKSRWDMGKPEQQIFDNESQINIERSLNFQCNSNTKHELEENQVSQWEKFSTPNQVAKDKNEIIDETTVESSLLVAPKKSMFFFGPGCLQVKPTIGPLKSDIASGSIADEKLQEVPILNSETQDCDNLNIVLPNLQLKTGSYEVTQKTNKTLLTSNVDAQSTITTKKEVEDSKNSEVTFKKPQVQKPLFRNAAKGETKQQIVHKSDVLESLRNKSEETLKNTEKRLSNLKVLEKDNVNVDCASESKVVKNETISDNNLLSLKEISKNLADEDEGIQTKAVETSENPISPVTITDKNTKNNEEAVKGDSKKCDNLKLSCSEEKSLIKQPETSTSTISNLEAKEGDKICNLPNNNIVTGNNDHVPKISVSKKELEKIDSSNSSSSTSSNISDDQQKNNKKSDVPVSEESHLSSSNVESEKSVTTLSPKKEVAGLPVAEELVANLNTSVLDNKPKSKLEDVQEDIKKVNIQKTDSNIDLSIKNKDSNITTSDDSIEMQMAMIMGENLSDIQGESVTSTKVPISTNTLSPPPLPSKSLPDVKEIPPKIISSETTNVSIPSPSEIKALVSTSSPQKLESDKITKTTHQIANKTLEVSPKVKKIVLKRSSEINIDKPVAASSIVLSKEDTPGSSKKESISTVEKKVAETIKPIKETISDKKSTTDPPVEAKTCENKIVVTANSPISSEKLSTSVITKDIPAAVKKLDEKVSKSENTTIAVKKSDEKVSKNEDIPVAAKKLDEKALKSEDIPVGVKKLDEKVSKSEDIPVAVKKFDEKVSKSENTAVAVNKLDEKVSKNEDIPITAKKLDEKASKSEDIPVGVKKLDEKVSKSEDISVAVKKLDEKVSKSENTAVSVNKLDEKVSKNEDIPITAKKLDEKASKKLDEKSSKKLDEKASKKLDEKASKKLDEKGTKSEDIPVGVKKLDEKVLKSENTAAAVKKFDEKVSKCEDIPVAAKKLDEKVSKSEDTPAAVKKLDEKEPLHEDKNIPSSSSNLVSEVKLPIGASEEKKVVKKNPEGLVAATKKLDDGQSSSAAGKAITDTSLSGASKASTGTEQNTIKDSSIIKPTMKKLADKPSPEKPSNKPLVIDTKSACKSDNTNVVSSTIKVPEKQAVQKPAIVKEDNIKGATTSDKVQVNVVGSKSAHTSKPSNDNFRIPVDYQSKKSSSAASASTITEKVFSMTEVIVHATSGTPSNVNKSRGISLTEILSTSEKVPLSATKGGLNKPLSTHKLPIIKETAPEISKHSAIKSKSSIDMVVNKLSTDVKVPNVDKSNTSLKMNKSEDKIVINKKVSGVSAPNRNVVVATDLSCKKSAVPVIEPKSDSSTAKVAPTPVLTNKPLMETKPVKPVLSKSDNKLLGEDKGTVDLSLKVKPSVVEAGTINDPNLKDKPSKNTVNKPSEEKPNIVEPIFSKSAVQQLSTLEVPIDMCKKSDKPKSLIEPMSSKEKPMVEKDPVSSSKKSVPEIISSKNVPPSAGEAKESSSLDLSVATVGAVEVNKKLDTSKEKQLIEKKDSDESKNKTSAELLDVKDKLDHPKDASTKVVASKSTNVVEETSSSESVPAVKDLKSIEKEELTLKDQPQPVKTKPLVVECSTNISVENKSMPADVQIDESPTNRRVTRRTRSSTADKQQQETAGSDEKNKKSINNKVSTLTKKAELAARKAKKQPANEKIEADETVVEQKIEEKPLAQSDVVPATIIKTKGGKQKKKTSKENVVDSVENKKGNEQPISGDTNRELRQRKVTETNKTKASPGIVESEEKKPNKVKGRAKNKSQKEEDKTISSCTRSQTVSGKDKTVITTKSGDSSKENEKNNETTVDDIIDIEEQIIKTEIRPTKKLKLSDSSVEVIVVDKSKKTVTTVTGEKSKEPEKIEQPQINDDKISETPRPRRSLRSNQVTNTTDSAKNQAKVVVPESKKEVDTEKKEGGENSEELKLADEPLCVQKKVPLLTCIDINKLKATPEETTIQEDKPNINNETIADTPNDSDDDSCGGDFGGGDFGGGDIGIDDGGDSSDDAVIIVPENDPLACSDNDIPASEAPAMTLSTFKLDVDDSSPVTPVTRVTRKRAAQQSIDALRETRIQGKKTTQLEKKEDVDSKRPKLKKRSVDRNLRRSIEEQKLKTVSSSEEDGENNDDKSELSIKQESGKKSKSIAKRRISTRSTRATDSPAVSSDAPSEASRTDASNTPPVIKEKKPRKQKKTLLGLEISAETESIMKGDTPATVRQSRRIAQLKIKEEAERRKLEEVTLQELKDEQRKRKGKKSEDKDYKIEKRKRNKNIPTEDETTCDAESDEKKKRKRKRKHWDPTKKFDLFKAWKSSSGSSSSEVEDEEEEIEEDEDHHLVVKSDHEFSPESDLEEGAEVQPMKRARTARKESDPEEEVDDCACQKCGQKDHPEWILLCDSCDCGWHCSCLRPALLVIPEGDWFCPPCQHITLVKNLEERLHEYDRRINKREMETRRKERLAYVGISLDNVLPSKETDEHRQKQRPHHDKESGKEDQQDSGESGSEESESDSESSSSSGSDSDEPVYQLRERRQAHSYRFNDYDELINSAIQDELEAVKGAGNQGRGKDIATIVNAEKEEAEAQRLKNKAVEAGTDEVATDAAAAADTAAVPVDLHPPDAAVETVVAPETTVPEEPLPPVVPPKYDSKTADDSDDEIIRPRKRIIGKKKHRKLNSLDVSSGDDAESDEDFKGSSSSESEEDFDEDDYSGSESSEADTRRGKRRKDSGPVRRSTRARISRYDRDFVNDSDSEEEEAPRRKKTRSIWDESESEESDRSWGRRKRKAANTSRRRKSTTGKVKKSKKKKKKRRTGDDSDPEVYRKKPNIKFGGLNDDEEIGRRTRGKKINYLEALGTDSEEEIRRKPPRIEESEEEYNLHEDEDFQQQLANEKDSDESGVDTVLQDIAKNTQRPKARGRGKSGLKIPRKPKDAPPPEFPPLMQDLTHPSMEPPTSLVDPTGLQPLQSLQSPLQSLMVQPPMMVPSMVQESDLQDPEDEPNPIEQINKNVEEMNEQEMEKMMEEEDYANKQLQLVALQIEKEKKRKEREAKKLEKLVEKEQKIPKKRGRKPKNQMLNAANADLVPPSYNESTSMLMNSVMANNAELSEPPGVSLPMFSEIAPVLNADGSPKKRRGRGKGKKTLAAEAAAIAAANKDSSELDMGLESHASSGSNTVSPAPDSPMHGTKLGIAAPPQPFAQSQPTPSVITRMLQSQPGQGSFPGGGAKYFGGLSGDPQLGPPGSYHPGASGPRGGPMPGPYQQPPPGMPHYPVVRSGPAPPHRLHSPGPPGLPPMYHTHRSLDPSPSGGGPINVSTTNRDRHSPAIVSPSSSSPLSKGDPTPPPPPYSRPQVGGHFAPGVVSSATTAGPRHISMVPPHLQQHRGSSSMSPYHPGVPPNYHYGSYPPPPPLNADEGQSPPVYPSPAAYSEPYPGEGGAPVQPTEGGTNKAFDDDTGGEFVGLVSYFSSQREDDLDT